jgi:nicotinamide mononucleotide transporter
MDYFEIFAATVGLLYIWLEYRASVWLWLVGIILPLCYIYIFYNSKFYAGMGINVYYFVICLYGWLKWSFWKNKGEEELKITHVPKEMILRLFAVFVFAFVVLFYLLYNYTDSPVALGDSFVTALSLVGMWMLAQKYAEQWCVWIVVNIVSTGLFVRQGLYPTGALYLIFSVVSFFGYRRWKSLISEQ